jgi:AcrR family transcriptional regulator
LNAPAGPTRKKAPERVRGALLECAARIAVEQGLSAVTVQAVAQAAGVSKGGLFHHFANKQALVDSLFDGMIARFDAGIDVCLAGDAASWGCFTRAYVRMVFDAPAATTDALWNVSLPVSLVADPVLKQRWGAWLARRLAQHADTDGAPLLDVVRLAADGAWFDWLLARGERPAYFPRVRAQLLLLASAP